MCLISRSACAAWCQPVLDDCDNSAITYVRKIDCHLNDTRRILGRCLLVCLYPELWRRKYIYGISFSRSKTTPDNYESLERYICRANMSPCFCHHVSDFIPVNAVLVPTSARRTCAQTNDPHLIITISPTF